MLSELIERHHGRTVTISDTQVKQKVTKTGGDKPIVCGQHGSMTANRLREIMRSRGMRQADLARATDQQPGTISKLVKGARSLDEHWARMFARALHVPAAAFYEPVGTPIPAHQSEMDTRPPEAARMTAIRVAWWPDEARAAQVMGVPLEKLRAQESGQEPLDPQYLLTLLRGTHCPVRWITDGDITDLEPRALVRIAVAFPGLVPGLSAGLGSPPEDAATDPSGPTKFGARPGSGGTNKKS